MQLRYTFPDECIYAFNRTFTGVFTDVLDNLKVKLVKEDIRKPPISSEDKKKSDIELNNITQ